MSRRGSKPPSLSSLLARRDNPYAGADLHSARRIVAAMLAFVSLLALALFPLDPPSAQIGWPGWAVGGLLVALGLAVAARLNRLKDPWTVDAMLAVAYLGLAGIIVLEWLAGKGAVAYDVLFVAWLVAGVIHPPRRAFPFLVALVAGLSLPVLYEGYSSALASRLTADGFLIVAAGAILTIYLDLERKRRVTMTRAGRLAKVDGLTGLPNRRAFEESLGSEVARAERSGSRLSLALIDLDDLKGVNDSYGHLEGDRCLRDLGGALERSIRAGDRCFRWAGDEFAVLLPDTDHEGGQQLLERVAEHVTATCTRPDEQALQISYGVSQLTDEVPAHELVAVADLELMGRKSAKRS